MGSIRCFKAIDITKPVAEQCTERTVVNLVFQPTDLSKLSLQGCLQLFIAQSGHAHARNIGRVMSCRPVCVQGHGEEQLLYLLFSKAEPRVPVNPDLLVRTARLLPGAGLRRQLKPARPFDLHLRQAHKPRATRAVRVSPKSEILLADQRCVRVSSMHEALLHLLCEKPLWTDHYSVFS